MKLRCALIVICCFLTMAVFAQDDWFVDKPIKDLTFIGLETVSVNELKPIVREYIGMNFSLELFWEIQGKLLELEYFEDIQANAREGDPEKTTVIIEFTVVERSSVTEIVLEGNKKVSNADILEVIGVKRGDFINETQIKVDEMSIADLYLEKGFTQIDVSSRRETGESPRDVRVIFSINEGHKVTIKAIDFSGNVFASASTLRGKLKHKKQSLFESGVFQENYLEEDKRNIIEYYHENGYIDISVEKIDRIIEEDEEKQRSYLSLVYYLSEGDRYTFGELIIEGNNVFSEEEIRELVRQKSGKEFNLVKFEEDFDRVVTLYTDSGYIFNSIDKIEERDESNNIVDYRFRIVEREKAHIGSITLEGNEKTKDYVIYRELPFEVGDIFSTEKLRQGYFNLYNLQYFSDIAYNPVPSEINGLMDLVINVVEQNMADIKFALVFSGGEFPVSGQIGWADKNFLGNGQTFGVDLEFSNLKQGLSLNFQDNYLFGRGWGGGGALSVNHTRIETAYQDIMAPIFTDEDIPDPFTSAEEYEALKDEITPSSKMSYDSLDLSFALNLGYFYRTILGKIGFNTKVALTPRYLWYDETKFRHYEAATRANVGDWVLINTWANTFYLDDRDIYYNPENGYLLQQDVLFAGGFFGSRHYIKLKSIAEGFLTLFELPVLEGWSYQMVLAAHGAASFVFPQLGGRYEATERDKLYIDSMNTARGHSSVGNGESMLDFSLELRTPLLKQYLWTTFYLDAAALWQERTGINTMGMEDFKFSIGAGLRLTVPGMPLRLYISQPFEFSDGRFRLVDGDFPLGPLNPKIVFAITPPGGF